MRGSTLARWALAGGVVACGPMGVAAEPSEYDKHLIQTIEKDPGSVAADRAYAELVYSQTRGPMPTTTGRVIYGADDRKEVYEYDILDPTLRAMADACAVVVRPSELVNNGNGTYTLLASPWTSQGGTLCATEPFRGQLNMGFCSSFLVGPDLITTAGHCVDAGDMGNVAFVFGFQLNDSDETGPTVVPAEFVYFGTQQVSWAQSGGLDHSVVRLDRPVTGINPVPVRYDGVVPNGTPLAVIGHPATILKKIAGGAEVKSNTPSGFFQANLDTYGGNSGSMVINLNTYTVEGILVRGAPDYVTVGGCVQSNRVPDTGNTGSGLLFEEVSKTADFASAIPPLGLLANPGGSTLHIGVTGGPFTPAETVYTLSNPTGDPVDYEIEIVETSAILVNGGTGLISGTIAGGGSTTATVSVDQTAAAGLSAGVYEVDLAFRDVTNSRTTNFTHVVEVGQTLVNIDGDDLFGGGPVGGPFPVSGSFTVTSGRPTPVTVSVESDAAWLDLNGSAGPLSLPLSGTGDNAAVSVTINSAAAALTAGIQTGTITFTNTAAGTSQSYTVTLDVGRYLFDYTGASVSIADNSTVDSTITVPVGFCIGDVDVQVDMTHTFSGDLEIDLISPQGTVVRLHDRSGSSADYASTLYDDDGTPGGVAPDGPGSLDDFLDENAAGVWTLRIGDRAGSDTGTLSDWQLRIAAIPTACPPAANNVAFSVPENGLSTVTLDGVAVNGGTLTYTITSLPARGVLWQVGGPAILSAPATLAGDSVLYRASVGQVGPDAFAYIVSENGVDSDPASADGTVGTVVTVASFPMDTNPGWATEGQWGFGVPQGLDGDPSSGATGSNVYGFNLSGEYTNNMAEFHLTSTPIDLSGVSGAELRFQRWLGVERNTYDHARVRISADGSSYTQVWENPDTSIDDTAWSLQTFDISALDGQPAARLRWSMGTTDGSVTFHGWNIDDVEVVGFAPGASPADLTGDGNLTFADVAAFINAFNSGSPLADLTGDGNITFADVAAFVNAFQGR